MNTRQLGTNNRHWRVIAAFILFVLGGIVYFSIWLWIVTSGTQMFHTWYWPVFATLVTSILGFVAPDKVLNIAADLLKGFSGREDR
jgi:cytochrome c biogenesis protein CcdA